MDDRRYYALDALRGTMMMLGIVLHGANFYLAAPPSTIPIPTDRNNAYAFDVIFHFIHSFRMPVFFVMAGFFASLLVEKRGLKGTYANRAKRILGPFVAAMLTILPLTALFLINFVLAVRFGTHDILPQLDQLQTLGEEMEAAGVPLDEPSSGHLWFLYYLLYFYLTIPLCRWFVGVSLVKEAACRRLVGSPGLFLLLGAYTSITLWPFKGAQILEGFIFLKPHVPSLIYYWLSFVMGYFFHYYREFLSICRARVGKSAVLALFLFPLSVYLSTLEYNAVGNVTLIHLGATIAHGFCTWALVYLFIGVFLRFFDYESPWTLYTSQSSYWVYLVHMPVIAVCGWWMVQYDLPAVVKFLAITSATALVCFTSYHYLVQRTWVSGFLTGRRFDSGWPWREPPVVGRRP